MSLLLRKAVNTSLTKQISAEELEKICIDNRPQAYKLDIN